MSTLFSFSTDVIYRDPVERVTETFFEFMYFSCIRDNNVLTFNLQAQHLENSSFLSPPPNQQQPLSLNIHTTVRHPFPKWISRFPPYPSNSHWSTLGPGGTALSTR